MRRACAEPAGFEDVLARVCLECGVALNANQYVLTGSTVRSMLSYLAGEGELEAVYEDGRMFLAGRREIGAAGYCGREREASSQWPSVTVSSRVKRQISWTVRVSPPGPAERVAS